MEIQQFDPEWLVRRGNYMTLITPEVAALLLEMNLNNRRPKKQNINRYARDMEHGKWDPDASDIKVSAAQVLIDGQNRLLACIQADTPFPTLLRTGVRQSARDHVDQGARRTVGDSFKMAGVSNATVVGAAVSLRTRYDRALAQGKGVTREMRFTLTHQEALDYLAAHPMVEKMAPKAATMATIGPGITRSVWFAFLSMAAEANESEAMKFAELWIKGESSGTGDPLLALNRYAAQAIAPSLTKTRDRMQAEKHLAALVKVWNAWRMGDTMERLFVRDSEALEPCV